MDFRLLYAIELHAVRFGNNCIKKSIYLLFTSFVCIMFFSDFNMLLSFFIYDMVLFKLATLNRQSFK